jgi:hypothetical protein
MIVKPYKFPVTLQLVKFSNIVSTCLRLIKSLKDVPLILETPKKKESDDLRNLKKVRRMLN